MPRINRKDVIAVNQCIDELQSEIAKLREENRELRRHLEEFEESYPKTQEGRFFRSCAVALLTKLRQQEGE